MNLIGAQNQAEVLMAKPQWVVPFALLLLVSAAAVFFSLLIQRPVRLMSTTRTCHTTSFLVRLSNDGATWWNASCAEGRENPCVFDSTPVLSDRVVNAEFASFEKARYVEIMPVTWLGMDEVPTEKSYWGGFCQVGGHMRLGILGLSGTLDYSVKSQKADGQAWLEPGCYREEARRAAVYKRLQHFGYEYKFAPEIEVWSYHEERAKEWGGHLTSITSQDEQAVISSLLGGNGIWTGGQRKMASNDDRDPWNVGTAEFWEWTGGSPWTYTNWGSGQPDRFWLWEDKVEIRQDGSWNDVSQGAHVRGRWAWQNKSIGKIQ